VRAVRVDRSIVDPRLYVDLCHMTPEGIARLARAFASAITRALQPQAPTRQPQQAP